MKLIVPSVGANWDHTVNHITEMLKLKNNTKNIYVSVSLSLRQGGSEAEGCFSPRLFLCKATATGTASRVTQGK